MIDTQAIIELTQALVRISSPPGEEQDVTAFLLSDLQTRGFDQVRADEHGSIVAVVEGAQPGPTLLFDAHTDTVGVAPGVPWQHAPYGGEVVGDRIYGRGSSDMKGALAAMIVAAAALDRSALAGRVVISASVMEEVLEGVALRAVMETEQPDLVVIGEASDLKLVHGGRGRAEIRLESIGRPAHTSAPHLGLNAVHALLPAVQAIGQLALPNDPVVGPGVMALTDIISEPYPGHSVIPSRCRATYDRRLGPGETPEAVLASLADLPTLPGAKLDVSIVEGRYTSATGTELQSRKWFPAWLLPEDDPFVRAAAHGLESVGLPVMFSTYQFCTNAAYSMGEAGVPTIGFGPSREALVHIVDEYVEVQQLEQAARGYRAIMEGIVRAA
ncbi:MAG: YgeY family selenium metabolism-linked hydrolase [Anaerolineales bacterium]